MPNWIVGVLRVGLVAAILLATMPISSPAEGATSMTADRYTFQNVRIGGTGLVTGIVFSEAQRDLAYARTDVGGAYRWSGVTGQWTPLQDSTGWDHWGYRGAAGIAASPTDGRKVWAAVGMYTNGVDPHNGAILRSRDRGNTWQTAELPFTLGGNMNGRTMGERLAVDPVNDRVLSRQHRRASSPDRSSPPPAASTTPNAIPTSSCEPAISLSRASAWLRPPTISTPPDRTRRICSHAASVARVSDDRLERLRTVP